MATSSSQWNFYDGTTWLPFDRCSNDSIEMAYQSGNSNVSVKIRRNVYSLDLKNMTQKNVHTGTERLIKREETGTNLLPIRTPLVPHGAHKRPNSSPRYDSSSCSIGTVPPTSGSYPSYTGTVPPKSCLYSPCAGTVLPESCSYSSYIGTVPQKSGTFSSDPGTLSPTTATPGPLPSPITTPPTAMPRKKYKHEPSKFPHGLGPYDTFFHKYTEIVISKKIPKDETCAICLTSLLEPADVEVPKKSRSSSLPLDVVCGLKKCSHMFHLVCIGTMLDSTPNVKLSEISISCPICQTIHGVRTGDQPLTGTMNVVCIGSSVPGYERFGTIRITYSFSHGTSEDGVSFNAAGFPRVCYVPNCPEGQLVLKLLRLAWDRRLIFTVGTSVTTGRPNCVVWNNIHHKTEPHSNTSGHGFPDPNFLQNIKMELAVQGVTEEELK